MVRINRWFTILVLSALILSACQPIGRPSEQGSQSVPTPNILPTPTPSPTVTSATFTNFQVELEKFSFTSRALEGNLLGDPATRTIYILLPPSYATSDRRYPVVYVLPWSYGKSDSNVWSFKTNMELLLKNAEAREVMLVFPDGSNKLGASQFRSSPTIGDYGAYIARDLVNYIDATYRTLPDRESRGLAGCSNGGTGSVRLGFKYPDTFSVIAASGANFSDDLKYWPTDKDTINAFKEFPQDPVALGRLEPTNPIVWYIQAAAGTASNPNNPPFYIDMPFRIVNGHGEFVTEVLEKIISDDNVHSLNRYIQQPFRLRGFLIQHGLYDSMVPTEMVHDFDQLLTKSGVNHSLLETKSGHCSNPWESESLKFMSEYLVFQEP